MSLSQKHAGLILVPWFNSDEWRYVYNLVYSNDKEKQVEALTLLKIWKMRTPILSTGIEGTLILLEVLVIDSESLPDEQISNLYAVALMRFLNLSAANSEKQGSFAKTSSKNELPKWLTNLRHDIAHGHQIPSKYNLKMGLSFGFNWLKEKYWDPQTKIINDYSINDETYSKLDDTLRNSLEIYVEINVNIFENTDVDHELYEKIGNIISKKFKRKNLHPDLMLEIFLATITQGLEKDHSTKNIEQCLDILVSTKAMLKPNFDYVSEESGEESTVKLDTKFVNIWTNLLNLLHRFGLLFCLVDRLFSVIGNIVQLDNSKKVASLWINVIFQSLQNLKDPDNSKVESLCLEKNDHVYSEESLEFQNKVLYYSTECSAVYTAEFLDSLLKYSLSNGGYSSDALNLLQAKSTFKNLHEAESKIYTLNDLKFQIPIFEDVVFSDLSEQNNKFAESADKNSGHIVGGKRWEKIEDTSIFNGCPLGVLPHQIAMKHPFLVSA